MHLIERTPIYDERLKALDIELDLLRLDLLHPTISGNKWFKLKYNIEAAKQQGADSILSFGGTYSNHLHALAFAGNLFGIKTIGIIRGETISNATLEDCTSWGMELHFISRSDYKKKYDVDYVKQFQDKFPNTFIIPEGGNNEFGLQGTREILECINQTNYTYITCSIGTGATFQGLLHASQPHVHVLGFPAIKNGHYLEDEIRTKSFNLNWSLQYDFHFGGFAKSTPELLHFMNDFKTTHQIELDRVYTAKMMFGIFSLVASGFIPKHSRIIAVHTGGLQGNRH